MDHAYLSTSMDCDELDPYQHDNDVIEVDTEQLINNKNKNKGSSSSFHLSCEPRDCFYIDPDGTAYTQPPTTKQQNEYRNTNSFQTPITNIPSFHSDNYSQPAYNTFNQLPNSNTSGLAREALHSEHIDNYFGAMPSSNSPCPHFPLPNSNFSRQQPHHGGEFTHTNQPGAMGDCDSNALNSERHFQTTFGCQPQQFDSFNSTFAPIIDKIVLKDFTRDRFPPGMTPNVQRPLDVEMADWVLISLSQLPPAQLHRLLESTPWLQRYFGLTGQPLSHANIVSLQQQLQRRRAATLIQHEQLPQLTYLDPSNNSSSDCGAGMGDDDSFQTSVVEQQCPQQSLDAPQLMNSFELGTSIGSPQGALRRRRGQLYEGCEDTSVANLAFTSHNWQQDDDDVEDTHSPCSLPHNDNLVTTLLSEDQMVHIGPQRAQVARQVPKVKKARRHDPQMPPQTSLDNILQPIPYDDLHRYGQCAQSDEFDLVQLGNSLFQVQEQK